MSFKAATHNSVPFDPVTGQKIQYTDPSLPVSRSSSGAFKTAYTDGKGEINPITGEARQSSGHRTGYSRRNSLGRERARQDARAATNAHRSSQAKDVIASGDFQGPKSREQVAEAKKAAILEHQKSNPGQKKTKMGTIASELQQQGQGNTDIISGKPKKAPTKRTKSAGRLRKEQASFQPERDTTQPPRTRGTIKREMQAAQPRQRHSRKSSSGALRRELDSQGVHPAPR